MPTDSVRPQWSLLLKVLAEHVGAVAGAGGAVWMQVRLAAVRRGCMAFTEHSWSAGLGSGVSLLFT